MYDLVFLYFNNMIQWTKSGKSSKSCSSYIDWILLISSFLLKVKYNIYSYCFRGETGLLRAVIPNLFGTRGWFHGRKLFHVPEVEVMVAGWFKSITFIVHLYFISNLMFLLISRRYWALAQRLATPDLEGY